MVCSFLGHLEGSGPGHRPVPLAFWVVPMVVGMEDLGGVAGHVERL
jgi:hypothetical protein